MLKVLLMSRSEETFLSSERNEEHVMQNGGNEIIST